MQCFIIVSSIWIKPNSKTSQQFYGKANLVEYNNFLNVLGYLYSVMLQRLYKTFLSGYSIGSERAVVLITIFAFLRRIPDSMLSSL
uniref:Uncharacterized protein n=1 Tax=Populus trichocarpa TaxID=3694 RepID=A0A2K1Z8M6_POPTR